MEGIVLIDEIYAHLHLELQKKILVPEERGNRENPGISLEERLYRWYNRTTSMRNYVLLAKNKTEHFGGRT